jgi:hypothetical protein
MIDRTALYLSGIERDRQDSSVSVWYWKIMTGKLCICLVLKDNDRKALYLSGNER